MMIFCIRPGNTDNGCKRPEFGTYLLVSLGFRSVILLVANPKTHTKHPQKSVKTLHFVTHTQHDLQLCYILHVSDLKTCTK